MARASTSAPATTPAPPAGASPLSSQTPPSPSPPSPSPRRELRVRRWELILAPHRAAGELVVKDAIAGRYVHFGPEESLLLRALDGRNTFERIQRRYKEQFERPLTREEFDHFIELADFLNLLREKV